jgi:hypothetical protein
MTAAAAAAQLLLAVLLHSQPQLARPALLKHARTEHSLPSTVAASTAEHARYKVEERHYYGNTASTAKAAACSLAKLQYQLALGP